VLQLFFALRPRIFVLNQFKDDCHLQHALFCFSFFGGGNWQQEEA